MSARSATLLGGIALILLSVAVPAPGGFPESAWRAAALALAMALWWVTEALPLSVTALVPLAVAPLVGLSEIGEIARSYSHPLVILFMGGFILAKAIEKRGLARHLAASLLGLAGARSRAILAALMLATAFLSLWISNTASAMVMAPIAAAIARSDSEDPGFGTALMLGVAFAATIGGMGSLIGTPPNAILAAYMSETHGVEIGFARWAAIGLPVATVLLVLAWSVLVWGSPRVASGALRRPDLGGDAQMTTAAYRVAAVAGVTALAWIARPVIGWTLPNLMLSDAGIAVCAAIALFILPDGKGGRLLDWETAATIRWDVLILFGGGLALAGLLENTGLAGEIGGSISAIAHLPQLMIVLLIAALIVYIGELASNTAMAAIFIPIAGAMALSLGADPVAFVLPIAFASSVGFMLPVATPPNAIVFADPAVTRAAMLRAGAPLDIIGILVAIGCSIALVPFVFG